MAEMHYDVTPFIDQAEKILDKAKEYGVTIRLLGAIAFHVHCPEFRYFQEVANRGFTDVDFAAYLEQRNEIDQLYKSLGYTKDRNLDSVPGIMRSIFYSNDQKWHSDVFYNVLDFCHPINFKGRLEIDYPTISLDDLLLEKMQIVKINEKDVIDTLMLLREHSIGVDDKLTINPNYLAQLMRSDWGLWKTFTDNLTNIQKSIKSYQFLNEGDQSIISSRISDILQKIENEPKTLKWKLRDQIGERVKWYKDVDELY